MEITLKGKVALITGGNGAIGRQICLYLNRAGAKVIGAGLPSDVATAEEQLARGRAHGIDIDMTVFDVSDFQSTRDAIQGIEARYGHIDILINCAGITRDAPLRKMTADQWQQVMSVNLDSVFNSSRHVIDGMTSRGWGRIVNISSVNGQKGQFGQTNYSASKAGVHGFTMALALEVARKGVTVNTIAPGYIDSPMIHAVPQAIRDKILEGIPAGRYGMARDIASAVTFLCSPQASYITGAQLPVNGGFFVSS
ncbi:MAG: beta-ketoacyl-ACP reductase [Panacagrimonas sp.]